MPTLFDDEEFFVPPPKKTPKEKKGANDKKSTDSGAPTSEEGSQPLAEVDKNVQAYQPETTEAETSTPLSPDMDITPGTGVNNSQITEGTPQSVTTASSEAEAQSEEPTSATQQEEVQTNTPLEASGDDYIQHVAAAAITFEIPEEEDAEDFTISPALIFEDNQQEEDEVTAADSAVLKAEEIPQQQAMADELDQLLRSELIVQDYVGSMGLQFETEARPAPQPVLEPEPPAPKVKIEEVDFDFELEKKKESHQLPEFELEDRYYTIGEVAEMFRVNVSHIRFWTTEFKLKVRTTRKGDRLYNPENIARLRLIHHLVKENKYTIKGAKEQLKAQAKVVSKQVDLKEKLNMLKQELERIKNNL